MRTRRNAGDTITRKKFDKQKNIDYIIEATDVVECASYFHERKGVRGACGMFYVSCLSGDALEMCFCNAYGVLCRDGRGIVLRFVRAFTRFPLSKK